MVGTGVNWGGYTATRRGGCPSPKSTVACGMWAQWGQIFAFFKRNWKSSGACVYFVKLTRIEIKGTCYRVRVG